MTGPSACGPPALPPTDRSGALNGDTGEVFAEHARTDAAAAVDTRQGSLGAAVAGRHRCASECQTFAQARRALLDADEPTTFENQCSASEYEVVIDVATEEVGAGTANEVEHPEDNARW